MQQPEKDDQKNDQKKDQRQDHDDDANPMPDTHHVNPDDDKSSTKKPKH